MELNNTTQYAIRILSYIAKHGENKLISAKHLSENLDIQQIIKIIPPQITTIMLI